MISPEIAPPAAPATTLVIAGLGYTGAAVAAAAIEAGFPVTVLTRDPAGKTIQGADLVAFDDAAPALERATHLLLTAPPSTGGDPVLRRHSAAIERAKDLRWIGYFSTTGVYGDRAGGAVDETTSPKPDSERTRNRVAAELAWSEFADRAAIDIIRLAGIYGPGRSSFDDLRAGTARRIDKPGHKFSRIHVGDIAAGVLAAIRTATEGVRVLNFADDEPAPSADVVAYAAGLLGLEPPPLIPFEQAARDMSPMALSFWSENRIVRNAATKSALGLTWTYPTYREGLRAILAKEQATG